MNFKIWIESEQNLKSLFLHVLLKEKIGPVHPYEGREWHFTLVRMLRNIGWDQYAEELELYKPSLEDIECANSYSSPRATAVEILKSNCKNWNKQHFYLISRNYHQTCDDIIKRLARKIADEKWLSKAIEETY